MDNVINLTRVGGSNIKFSLPVAFNKVSVHAPEQTIEMSIQREDGMFWNFTTPGWTEVVEPTLEPCVELLDTGKFQTLLTGGYTSGDGPFAIHIVGTGPVVADLYVDMQLSVDSEEEFENIKGSGFVKNTHSLINIFSVANAIGNNIGPPFDLGDGATISGMLTAMADDSGGATFNSLYNSLVKITNLAGGTDWTPLEQLEIKAILGVTGTGTPVANPTDGSVKYLQDILANIDDAVYNGALWLNGIVANPSALKGKDGIVSNPVSTWEAIETLSGLTGIKTVFTKSPPVVDRDMTGYTIIGLDGNVSLDITT